MIFVAPSAEVFEKMMCDPGKQKDFKKTGVISMPTSTILNKV